MSTPRTLTCPRWRYSRVSLHHTHIHTHIHTHTHTHTHTCCHCGTFTWALLHCRRIIHRCTRSLLFTCAPAGYTTADGTVRRTPGHVCMRAGLQLPMNNNQPMPRRRYLHSHGRAHPPSPRFGLCMCRVRTRANTMRSLHVHLSIELTVVSKLNKGSGVRLHCVPR